MQREILFRGKRVDNGEWVFGGITPYEYDGVEIMNLHEEQPGVFKMIEFPVVSETVGQFIGLTDKNGKKIFEGDLVKVNHPDDHSGDFTDSIQKVFYWRIETGFYHGNGERPPKRMWEYVEIIGNIHDNGAKI